VSILEGLLMFLVVAEAAGLVGVFIYVGELSADLEGLRDELYERTP
jgi:hypothetical protein